MYRLLILSIIPFISISQSLTVINPSFEGPVGAGITPAPWFTCMDFQTPDTQPGNWGVTLPASEGATYLGFVEDFSMAWQEGATQELVDEADPTSPLPMIAGTNYQFTIDIAGYGLTSGFFFSPNAELLIYGGFANCPQDELLWSSGDTPDNIWTTYTVDFTPSADYTYIMLQINTLDSSGYGSILIDNMTPIVPQCQLLTIDNIGQSCQGNDGFIETSIVDNGDATPPFNYVWSNGFEGNPMYTDIEGEYYVEVNNDDGCELTSNIINVIVNQLPETSNILGDPVVGINTINNYYVQSNSGSSYEWEIENIDGDILSGQGTNTIEVSWDDTGYAIIYVTETNILSGCEFETSITVEVNDYSSLNEHTENNFTMFPNPLTQQSILQINSLNESNFDLEIIDASGKKVYSKNNVGGNNLDISCSKFEKGLYIVNIVSSEVVERKILIIQ